MFKLGLTGSIGMGKSTTAGLFAAEGCAVWDADAAVHRLYSKGGAAVEKFRKDLPEAVKNEEVSRTALKSLMSDNPKILQKIETIVHPLVRKDREEFARTNVADIAVFDIPLLYETKSATEFDAVACVFVDAATQKERVMARGTMTESQFAMILSKQMPIEEKLALADYSIETDTIAHAQQQVKDVVAHIRGK